MLSANDIYNQFCEISAPCKSWKSYENISIVGDHRVKYSASISPKSKAAAFSVDGSDGLFGTKKPCISCCDKALLVERPDKSCNVYLIEMKSNNDISKAISQLKNTVADHLFCKENFYKRECIIVNRAMPRHRPGREWQDKQKRFMAETGCPMRRVSINQIDNIEIS